MINICSNTKTGNVNSPVIGLLGGMGSYSTIDFFKRIVDSYEVEKEWQRPHIIIDNFCTMPSRVKAILTHEDEEELIECISYSVRKMMEYGADYIIFTCNTSHYFIPAVLSKVPDANNHIVDMVSICSDYARSINCSKIGVIGSEGTLMSGIYQNRLSKNRVTVEQPKSKDYPIMRMFIEAVKQNRVDYPMLKKFANYINNMESDVIILGCTEYPILYHECINNNVEIIKTTVDPVDCVIEYIHSEVKTE